MVIDKGDGERDDGAGAPPASGGAYSDQHLRVSDAEREAVRGRLAEHFAAGRLDPAEFDDRAGRARSAKTRGDLRGLFADLSETGARPGQSFRGVAAARRGTAAAGERARAGVADRVPAGCGLGGADLPAAGAPGRARAAAGLSHAGRSAAQGPGRGGLAGHQPEHGAEGLQGAGDQGPGGRPARPGHVHPGHPGPGRAARARRAEKSPARLADRRGRGRTERGRDGRAVHQRATGFP